MKKQYDKVVRMSINIICIDNLIAFHYQLHPIKRPINEKPRHTLVTTQHKVRANDFQQIEYSFISHIFLHFLVNFHLLAKQNNYVFKTWKSTNTTINLRSQIHAHPGTSKLIQKSSAPSHKSCTKNFTRHFFNNAAAK